MILDAYGKPSVGVVVTGTSVPASTASTGTSDATGHWKYTMQEIKNESLVFYAEYKDVAAVKLNKSYTTTLEDAQTLDFGT